MPRVDLSVDEMRKINRFTREVIEKGQSNKHFFSEKKRTPDEQFDDTFRGKCGEVGMFKWCKMKGISVSEIDWETGKGTFGRTSDCGTDLSICGKKASINTIKPYDRYLLIPVTKFKFHIQDKIDCLILVEVDGDIRKINHVDILGYITLEDFNAKKDFFGKGEQPMNLVSDNVGVPKSELSSILTMIKPEQMQGRLNNVD
jgi:hypothetical protein